METDYIDVAVPSDARKKWHSVMFVWLGFLISAGVMATGGAMMADLSMTTVLGSIFVGNLVLAGLAALSGWIGAVSGKTFHMLMSDAFPGQSAKFVSLYVPIILVGWYGIVSAILGQFIGDVLGLDETAKRVLMVVLAVLFSSTTYFGFSGIRNLSVVLVPIIAFLGIYAITQLPSSSDNAAVQGHQGLGAYSRGIFLVISTWIMGAMLLMPDITRFAKNGLQGAVVAGAGLFVGNSLNLILGSTGAAMSGQSDPAAILLGLGFAPLAVLVAVGNLWTTNDSNMYSSAICVSRMLGFSRRKAVFLCMGIGAAFAATNPSSATWIFRMLSIMGLTAPPLGTIVMLRFLLVRTGFWTSGPPAYAAWIAWIGGALLALMLEGLVGLAAGIIVGGSVYVLLSLITQQQRN